MENGQNNYKVSIIIPSYNQAQFLGDAIESSLNQSYKNIEVIVVDDGSTDSTKQLVKGFNKVTYIYQKNEGQGSARNKGLKLANGEYVVFLDSDDKLLENAVEVGINALNHRPNCAFVYGHAQLIDESGFICEKQNSQKIIDKDYYEKLLKGNYIWTMGTAIFRKWILKDFGGFDNFYKGGQDWELYLRITREHPIHCHGKIVVGYRVHNSNFTKNFALMLKYSHLILHSQKKYIRGNEKLENAYKRGIDKLNEYYGEPLIENTRSLLRKRRYFSVIKNTLTLIRYYPKGFARKFLFNAN